MSFSAESLKAGLDRDSAYVGETVVYRIELKRPPDVSVEVPANLDLSPFSLNGVSRRTETLSSGLVRETLELEIGLYTVEEAEVPAFDLVAVTEGGLQPIPLPAQPLEVLSIVAEEGESPRELAPPDTIWVPDYAVLKAAGFALAVLLVLLLLWKLFSRLRGRPRKAPPAKLPPPPRPAHEVALEALRALREEGLVARGERRLYFFRLSEIVREYAGARYGFESLELTTTELLVRLRDRPTPGLDLGAFSTFCADCDMVKFARHEPTDAECSAALDRAFGFVETTKRRSGEDEGSPAPRVAAGEPK